MRDVTDSVTGELDVAVKRGRGRPRKEGALTNAQRQAAYRARRSESVTVTKNAPVSRLVVDQVGAYDEYRLEVEQLRAELAEAHETIDELNGCVRVVHDELLAVRRQLELAEAERSKAFAVVDKLQVELATVKKGAAKSVTSAGNRNKTALYAEIKRSSKYYGQTERGELFAVSILCGGEYVVQGGPGGQYRLSDVWLWVRDGEGKKMRLG